MDVQTKILQLRNNIAQSLKMVIGRKCILLDVPYYHNIGDVLIWNVFFIRTSHTMPV